MMPQPSGWHGHGQAGDQFGVTAKRRRPTSSARWRTRSGGRRPWPKELALVALARVGAGGGEGGGAPVRRGDLLGRDRLRPAPPGGGEDGLPPALGRHV